MRDLGLGLRGYLGLGEQAPPGLRVLGLWRFRVWGFRVELGVQGLGVSRFRG